MGKKSYNSISSDSCREQQSATALLLTKLLSLCARAQEETATSAGMTTAREQKQALAHTLDSCSHAACDTSEALGAEAVAREKEASFFSFFPLAML